MTTPTIRAALERLISAYDEHGGRWTQTMHDEDPLDDAVERARADLAAADPDPAGGGEALLAATPMEGEDPTTEELNRLYREIYGLHSDALGPMPRKFARAVLARWGRSAAPAALVEGEVGKLVAWLRSEADINESYELTESAAFQRRAATLLQQQAAELAALRARVMPVPVSERPWEREGWCDKQGRCWFLSSRFLTWSLASPPVALTCQIARLHSLPFHAIPLPWSVDPPAAGQRQTPSPVEELQERYHSAAGEYPDPDGLAAAIRALADQAGSSKHWHADELRTIAAELEGADG